MTRRLFIKFASIIPLLSAGTDFAFAGWPSQEVQEGAYPRLINIRADKAVLEWPRYSCTLRVGDSCREWELVAVISEPEPLAVLERNYAEWGALSYVGKRGPVATLKKTIGKLLPQPQRKAFSPQYFDRLLSARKDVLGQEAFLRGGEPSYDLLFGLLPPLQAYTFLGTKTSHEKLIVWPDGRLGFGVQDHRMQKVLFHPADTTRKSAKGDTASREGLVGGYLPVIDYVFSPGGSVPVYEQTSFSVGRDNLETYVRLRSASGKRTYWRLPGSELLRDGTRFYDELLGVQREWEGFFAKGIRLELPDRKVNDSSKAGIVRALITEVGTQPKYGVGAYSAKKHDTFPPATILLAWCLMDWGLMTEARDRLGYYLDHYVREDGTFDYYGPALSAYGQTLTMAARYVRLTQDISWLHEYLPVLRRVGGFLVGQMKAARERYPPNSPDYGLLWGAAEADTRKDKRCYFSSDTWCWRGLVEMGRLLTGKAQWEGDVSSERLGRRWLKEAESFQLIVHRALSHALEKDSHPPFLPPAVDIKQPFEFMTENRFASYTNYRYWPEMLSAGMLPAAMRDAIIAYRTTHGGELAGTTRFEDVLDDWPYAHYGWGLLDADQIDHYLLGFYGHLAFHQTPGTLTAFESVKIKGDRTRDYSTDYCVPSQLVVPQLLRWMLAWEPWDKEELWLGRAVPKRWFERGFSVRDVPTRWGAVSFRAAQNSKGLEAQIERGSVGSGLKVFARLRPMWKGDNPRLAVVGTNSWKWHANQEAVELWGAWRKVTIRMERPGKRSSELQDQGNDLMAQ